MTKITDDLVNLVAIGKGMLTDPEFADHVIYGEPLNKCFGCRNYSCFTDRTACPGRRNCWARLNKKEPR